MPVLQSLEEDHYCVLLTGNKHWNIVRHEAGKLGYQWCGRDGKPVGEYKIESESNVFQNVMEDRPRFWAMYVECDDKRGPWTFSFVRGKTYDVLADQFYNFKK